MNPTLKSVFEVQEAVFCACGVGGGRRVAKLGVSLVAFRLADPGEADFGCVIDDDVIARANVERSEAVDEKLWKNKTQHKCLDSFSFGVHPQTLLSPLGRF